MSEKKADNQLHAMRHSLAHIMAAAIQKLWPETKFGVGPVIDNGFYYDVDLGNDTLSEDDLSRIEKEMKKIIDRDEPFEQFDLKIDEAIEREQKAKQSYKVELLKDLKEKGTTAAGDVDKEALGVDSDSAAVKEVSYYKCGDFVDLCRGPHVGSTGKVGAFKLHKLAGAYWRGDEDNPQMQRVYGVAFTTQDKVDEYFERLKEAKKRDHRKLGQELGLFTFSELIGSGLPLFTPKGAVLRDLLGRYSQQLRSRFDFQKVWIPHLTKHSLYEKSGHWEKFGEELFLVESQETSDELVLKPMNCPHHAQLYSSKPRSYRDLPVKYMENTTVYRDEKSGELHGIERVRSITQDDCHVFCRRDQIDESVNELIISVKELYDTVGMEIKRVHLSLKDDADKWLGDDELWKEAQSDLEKLAKENELEYVLDEGEAAFYGPKIDFIAEDAIGRETQVATVQLDFVQPERFELTYTDDQDEEKTPVMIHSALLGSLERFLSVYIEHTAGKFPFWLAPEQIRILTINDQVLDYVEKITSKLDETVLMEPLKYNELRYHVDARNESLGKKIREAELEKVPAMFIIGPRDAKSNNVSIRDANGEEKIELEKLHEYVLSKVS